MMEGQISSRLDPDFKARIRELAHQGEYRDVSDFMNQAILLMFAFDRIPFGGRLLGHDTLAEVFSSYSGRRLLRVTVQEGLAG
jgi:hypothetical protein